MNKSLKYFLFIVLAVAVSLSFYFTFKYEPKCNTFACFQASMQECKKTSLLSEEKEASWYYKIKGAEGDECAVNVKLLQAKEGELDIEKLAGYDMDCYFPLGVGTYPHKDLEKCHGRLKEEFQAIIIKKLHIYVLENMGQLGDILNKTIATGFFNTTIINEMPSASINQSANQTNSSLR